MNLYSTSSLDQVNDFQGQYFFHVISSEILQSSPISYSTISNKREHQINVDMGQNLKINKHGQLNK